MVGQAAFAATARDKYYKAESCYKKLRNSPKKQKYRDKWLACIDKFKAVYRYDPSDPWAPAGLFMAGTLYQELYKRSFKKSDKEEENHLLSHCNNIDDYSIFNHSKYNC